MLPASRAAERGLILRAIRAGAREFLPLPAEPAELLEIITRLLREPQRVAHSHRPTAHGSSPSPAPPAASAAPPWPSTWPPPWPPTKEHETILLDLDLIFGSVDAYLDIAPDHTLTHVVQNFDRLDLTLLKRSITRHASGLYVLPHPIAIQEAAAIDPGDPAPALRPACEPRSPRS